MFFGRKVIFPVFLSVSPISLHISLLYLGEKSNTF